MLNKGNISEKVVLSFLKKRGYQILEKNFKLPKIGEIDIIALKNKKIHCIEVKSSWSFEKYFLWFKMTPSKIKKVLKTFELWIKTRGIDLSRNFYNDYDIELDFAEVKKIKNKFKIKIIHNIN